MESRQVVSSYDIRRNFEDNVKHFEKFKVPMLEKCAASLVMKTLSTSGKKLYVKDQLVKKIVAKIKSHLPQSCSDCKEVYTVELEVSPPFSCFFCSSASHDCDAITKLHAVLPPVRTNGFVWLCGVCMGEPQDEQDWDTGKTEVDLTEDDDGAPLVDKKEVNDRKVKKRDEEPEICKFYINKRCKFGANGKDCPFNHPKKCFKFMQNGSKPRRGCSKGKDCKFYHPPLCRVALRTGMCPKEDCNFHHIRGTTFKNEWLDEKAYNGDVQTSKHGNARPINKAKNPSKLIRSNESRNENSYASVARSKETNTLMRQEQDVRVSVEEERTGDGRNFQMLRQLIQQMQIQLQGLMNSQAPTVTKQCPCRMNCH